MLEPNYDRRKNSKHCFDIDFKITNDGITPLMLACTTGNIDIVKMLLINPLINIHYQDNAGINAVYVSAYYGHLYILKLLKVHGAIFKPSHKGTTMLHVASRKGHTEIVKFLLYECHDQRIPIDCLKFNGMTPIMMAVKNNHVKVIRIL